MVTLQVTNPKTGRPMNLRAWRIEPRAVVAMFKDGRCKSARDLSWVLLADESSMEAARETDAGDDAASNWGLSILENALDWTLGSAVVNLIRASAKRWGKMPKPFHVGCNRKGDVYVVLASGTVLPC